MNERTNPSATDRTKILSNNQGHDPKEENEYQNEQFDEESVNQQTECQDNCIPETEKQSQEIFPKIGSKQPIY